MMNHNFSKPMSADYARLVVTKANKREAASNQSKQPSKSSSKNAPVDLLDSTSIVTIDSAVSVVDAAQDQDPDQKAVAQRKKTWWRQLVLSQSMVAMLKAPGRRG